MPRVTFSNELNDFVKGFTAGSAIYNAAEKNSIDRLEANAKKGYYEAYARRFGAGEDETAPFIEGGVKRFGPEGEGAAPIPPITAVPTEAPAAAPSAGKPQPPTFLNAINEKYPTLPAGYLSNNAYIESQYNPNAHAKRSSAAGMFQFTDATAKRYGLTNRYDAPASAEATARMATEDSKTLTNFLKRTPTGGELYLAHQQGATGALRLLQNPDSPAIALVGRNAIVNNGGRADMTAREFTDMWLRKWEAKKGEHAALDVEPPMQAAAHGGMIHGYEEGGPVAPAEPQEKPYYINDLMDDVGNAMGKLGEVVHAGLQGLQEKFGLNERPAVAQADPDYQNRVAAFARNDGAPPAEQVEAMRSKVDPENRLGAALGTTYGMIKAYDHYLAKGDVKSATSVATSLLQYTKAQSQQLGALALQAVNEGDTTSAAKALTQAYNAMPNGKQATVEGNKVTITDERTGKVIESREFTPAMLVNAAMSMTTGQAYLDDLSHFATSEKLQIAQGHDATKLATHEADNATKTTIAGENNETRRDIASGHDETSRTNTQETNDTRRAVGAAHDETSRANTSETNQTRRDTNAATNETSRANNADNNETRRSEGAANRTSREGIAERGETGKDRRQAVDLGFKGDEGAANRTSREGIAAGRNQTALDIAGQNNQTRRDEGMANREVKLSEGVANRETRTGIAAENRAVRQSEGAANRGAAMDRTKLRTDTSTSNNERRIEATGARQDKQIAATGANLDKNISARSAEGDKNRASREGMQSKTISDRLSRAGSRRSDREIDTINKMTPYQVLGVDEATTPQVNTKQAEATKSIALGIAQDSAGKSYGRAADFARMVTEYDRSARKPVYNVKLNDKDSTVTMPDGSVLAVSPATFQHIKRVRMSMGAQ